MSIPRHGLTGNIAGRSLTVVDEATLAEWGRNIRDRRLACGFDRYDLADALEVRYGAVWRWENGERAPRDHMKIKIARVLRTDVRTLFPLIVPAEAS